MVSDLSMGRVLLLVDEPSVRALLHEIMRSEHVVEVVDSAERAMTILQTAPFDLFVCGSRIESKSAVKLMQRARGVRPKMLGLIVSPQAIADLHERDARDAFLRRVRQGVAYARMRAAQ